MRECTDELLRLKEDFIGMNEKNRMRKLYFDLIQYSVDDVKVD
jgi:hypothetical protein